MHEAHHSLAISGSDAMAITAMEVVMIMTTVMFTVRVVGNFM